MAGRATQGRPASGGIRLINYQSYIDTPPPAYSPVQSGTPYQLPGAHEDVYGALMATNAAGIEAARNQATVDFENSRLAARQQAALTGLQSMAQARQNQESLATQRAAARYGVVNNLLSGLFR